MTEDVALLCSNVAVRGARADVPTNRSTML